MRYFITSILCFLIISSCSKNNGEKDTLSFIGEWQLTEQNVSIGGPSKLESVDNGKTFILFSDGRFTGMNRFSCGEGNYISNETELTFNYTCDQNLEEFIYRFTWDNHDLILTPRTILCTDGCSFKYQKLN